MWLLKESSETSHLKNCDFWKCIFRNQSLVIDYQKVVIDYQYPALFSKLIYKAIIDYHNHIINYQCFKTLRFSKFKIKSHICLCVIDYTLMVIDYQWLFSKNSFPKVTFLQVTCFWRFFQKSYLFQWLVFKGIAKSYKFWLESSRNYKYMTLAWNNGNNLNHFFQTYFNIFFHILNTFPINLLQSFTSLESLWTSSSLYQKFSEVFWFFQTLKTCAIHPFHSLLPYKRFKGLTAWEFFWLFPSP